MNKIIFVLIIFQFQLMFSQETQLESKIKEKVEYLKENGSDTIVIYSQNCNGCAPKIIQEKACASDETKFVFWAKNGDYFMQKMDDCYEYVEQKIDESNFLKTIVNNSHQIEKAKIKPVQHNLGKQKKSNSKELLIDYRVNHFIYYDFEFHFKNKNFKKRIIEYEIETKMIDEKTPNDNYQYNQKSILKKLLDLVKKDVS